MATREEIRKRPHYVDNKKFLGAMIEFRNSVKKAKENGDERPIVPNYIAECIMKIATKYATRPNFSGYTYAEDMAMEGVENCLKYIDNFDPEKSSNPFAYFTRIIHFAFLRRIKTEKRQLYTVFKATENANLLGETSDRQSQDTGKSYNDGVKSSESSAEYQANFIKTFEETNKKKK